MWGHPSLQFWLASLLYLAMLSILQPLLTTCMSSWEKCLFRASACVQMGLLVCFCPWVVWAVWFILEIKPLSVMALGRIFFHPVGCLFISFVTSFAVQKALKFDQVQFVYFFALICLPLETDLGKHCCNLCLRMLCLGFLLGVLRRHVL